MLANHARRDPVSGAVVFSDKSALEKALKRREVSIKMREKEEEVDKLKKQVGELADIVKQLAAEREKQRNHNV